MAKAEFCTLCSISMEETDHSSAVRGLSVLPVRHLLAFLPGGARRMSLLLLFLQDIPGSH